MIEALKIISEKHRKTLTENGFNIVEAFEEKSLYISKDDFSLICNYNIMSISIINDAETFDLFDPEFFTTFKVTLGEEDKVGVLKIESGRRYVPFEININAKKKEEKNLEENEENISDDSVSTAVSVSSNEGICDFNGNSREQVEITEAIRFFTTYYLREVLKDTYFEKTKNKTQIANLD